MATANHKTKSDEAYAHIRGLLEDGKISANKLTEKKIIEVTGFSRSPVRDSLLRLEAEGIVRFNGHRRGRVIEYIEEQQIEEVLFRYELREYIQSGAVFLAAKHFNVWQIERLQSLVDEIKDPEGENVSAQDRFESMTNFYDYLIGNCGNPYFMEIWQKFRLYPLGMLSETTREKIKTAKEQQDSKDPSLQELVDAIAAHDAELAEQIAKKRVQSISSILRRELYN